MLRAMIQIEGNKPLRLGIAGLGTVGAATCKVIADNQDLLSARAGRAIEVVAVSARDKSKDRGVDLSGVDFCDDALALARHPDVDCVVELIGGDAGVARQLVEQAIANGKHVVSANKALVAKHGAALSAAADTAGVAFLFEAAVAGGIPILKTIREGLAANRFTQFAGILNGTCNFILTAMEREGRDFDDVLAEAQERGYAETPPDLDVDGWDAAHKLAIVTGLAFGVKLKMDAMHVEGIRRIAAQDMQFADEFGYRIRHLGITKQSEAGVMQAVYPAFVKQDSAFAGVQRVLNATYVEGDAIGSLFMMGPGAGGAATASSVVMDVVDLAAGRAAPSFGVASEKLKEAAFLDMTSHSGAYYLRLHVKDEDGVLADVTGLLREHSIGVERVLQDADEATQTAQIALITHLEKEVDIQAAIAALNQADYSINDVHMVRVAAI